MRKSSISTHDFPYCHSKKAHYNQVCLITCRFTSCISESFIKPFSNRLEFCVLLWEFMPGKCSSKKFHPTLQASLRTINTKAYGNTAEDWNCVVCFKEVQQKSSVVKKEHHVHKTASDKTRLLEGWGGRNERFCGRSKTEPLNRNSYGEARWRGGGDGLAFFASTLCFHIMPLPLWSQKLAHI